MKTITFNELLDIISDKEVMFLMDDEEVLCFQICSVDDEDKEFEIVAAMLTASFQGGANSEVIYHFTANNNKKIAVSGKSIFLKDEKMNEVQIELLTALKLEKEEE